MSAALFEKSYFSDKGNTHAPDIDIRPRSFVAAAARATTAGFPYCDIYWPFTAASARECFGSWPDDIE